MTLAEQLAAKLAQPDLPRCWPQCDPADWIDAKDESRRGWRKVICKTCGVFIGWHPVEKKQAAAVSKGKS